MTLSSPREPPASIPTPVDALIQMLLATKSETGMVAALAEADRPANPKALQSEIKRATIVLRDYIAAQQKHEATATLLALLFIDATYVLKRLRRDGVLRPSRYGYQGSLIGTIVKTALQILNPTNASPQRIRYLESVIALCKLATNARHAYDEIVRTLQSRRDCVLKTLLVMLNTQFYKRWIADPSQPSASFWRHSSEDYAEATSLIFTIYASLFAVTDKCCSYVDTAVIAAGTVVYERLLLVAIQLVKFRDAETLINGLPYEATLAGKTVTIASIDPDIERSVKVGYIQSELQVAIRAYHLLSPDEVLSIHKLVDEVVEHKSLGDFLELVEHPVRRYRMMPSAMLRFFDVFSSFFSDDKMFREEVERLLFLDVNRFGSNDLLSAEINADVITADIFRLQRYFTVLSVVYQRKLEHVEDKAERLMLTFTSTVFVIPHDALVMHMMLIFKSEPKVHALIKLFRMTIDTDHLDLQYRPLIDVGSHYVIAPHLLAASNLVRNTIVSNKLRAREIGEVDPMVEAVADALREAGFTLEIGFELRAGGLDFELDIVAWRDGHLFFIECKNAYHPCSSHEMRNSYGHIEEAEEQLDKRRQIFTEPHHQKALFQKLGWAVEPTAHVHTAIVIANRVFHGARLNGHPVRQAHELINLLTRGRIVGAERSLSLWGGETFHAEDLVTYLSDESLIAKILRVLDTCDVSYSMGYRRLIFSSYTLDLAKARAVMEASYPVAVPPPEDEDT